MVEDKILRFRQVVEQNPDNELARYSLGTALFEAEQFEDAEEQFRAALENKNDWVLAYIFRARCQIRLGRTDEAKSLLRLGREYSEKQGHASPIEEIDDLLEMLP